MNPPRAMLITSNSTVPYVLVWAGDPRRIASRKIIGIIIGRIFVMKRITRVRIQENLPHLVGHLYNLAYIFYVKHFQ